MLRSGADGADVLHERGPLVGEAAKVLHRRRGPGAGSRGTSASWASRSSPRSAVAWPAMAALRKKPVTLVAVLGQRLQHGVAVAGEAGELVVLVGEDLEHAVGLAQGGVGAVDDLAEVVAAGGEAGAEVVEDEAEAVAVGGAVDVLDQVDVDGLAVVLERAAGAGPPPARRPRSPPARAAARWPAARGWVGVQSTSFSPISDCGRMMQEASSRKSLKPSSVMFMTTTALPGTGCAPPSRLAISSGPVTSTDSTVPTVAPAMRTSSPLTMKPPLSKMPRTL